MDKEQIKAISESIPMEQRFSVEQIVSAAIESYKAELLKEVGEPFAYAAFNKLQSCYEFSSDQEDVLAMPQTILPTFDLHTSDQVAAAIIKATKLLEDQLAASQAYAEQLRVAIDRVRSGAAALGLDRIFDIATEALALPRDTSALDAYVSDKVKEAVSTQKEYYESVFQDGAKRISTLTRQHDLAVEALEWALSNINCEPFEWSDEENADAHKAAIEALSAIKESEAMAQGEKK